MINYNVVGELNKKELVVYNYIMSNTSNIPFMTIRELSEKTKVSTTTVLKVIEKLGFNSYSEFKVYYRMNDSKVQTRNNLYGLDEVINSLEKLKSQYYMDKYNEAIEKINGIDNILFVGIGNSGVVAKYGARVFSSRGRFALHLDDPFMRVDNVKENTLLIALSVSGETKELLRIVSSYKKYNCPIIAITSTEGSTLAAISDVVLPYYLESERVGLSIDVTSQIPTVTMIEILAQMIN